MNFLQPQFLYGLFALSIPIIVHLFNFRKAKKVYFTNTAFIEQVKQTNSAKRKLKHYLVLLSRLLALTFLVFAFAQPFIHSEEDGLTNSHVVVYLDNSQSMSNQTYQEIRGLDEGVAYVNQLLELYPRETQFLLVTNDFSPFSNTFKNTDKVSDRLTEVTLSNAIRSYEEVNKRINSIALANNVNQYDVYWISDYQKSTFGELETESRDTTVTHHFIPITFGNIANLYIDSVFIDNPFDIEVNKAKVNVLMKNSGSQPISDAVLQLYLNDQQISTKTIDLDGNSNTIASFDVVYNFQERNSARFSIEDYPITFDNNFYFNLNAQRQLRVIEIRGQINMKAIEQVYANVDLFDYQLMPEGNIDYNGLNSTDLIILHGLTKLNSSLANQLYQYKKSGGKIVIIPSITFSPNEYALLTGTQITVVDSVENQVQISLQNPDLTHPFYADIFEDNASRFTMPLVKNTITWGRLNSLLSINSGEPYLSYHEDQGISYIFASPLSTSNTDLTQQAIFVPIMYKLASYKSNNNDALYHSIDQPTIAIQLDSIQYDDIYKLKQNDLELIPNQTISGNELIIEIPKNKIHPGFSNLNIKGETQSVIAFNNGRFESNLTQWTREELQVFSDEHPQFKLLNATEAANFSEVMQERYQGVHLWKYAIVFVLLFLFIEMLIIRFYKPTGK
jgi:hypothetical protein